MKNPEDKKSNFKSQGKNAGGFVLLSLTIAIGSLSLLSSFLINDYYLQQSQGIEKRRSQQVVDTFSQITQLVLRDEDICKTSFRGVATQVDGGGTFAEVTKLYFPSPADPTLPGPLFLDTALQNAFYGYTIWSIRLYATQGLGGASHFGNIEIQATRKPILGGVPEGLVRTTVPAYVVLNGTGSHVESCMVTAMGPDGFTIQDKGCQVQNGANSVYNPAAKNCETVNVLTFQRSRFQNSRLQSTHLQRAAYSSRAPAQQNTGGGN